MRRAGMLWLDLETYCETPISYGTHRYARDAEILLLAYAIDDAPARVWDCTADPQPPAELRHTFFDTITAHKSDFDRTVLRHCMPYLFGDDVSIWRDTMAQALAHSLPAGLANLCDALGVSGDEAKDKEARKIMMLFCKPRPKNQKLHRATRETHPHQWAAFIEYARRDVEAMRACAKRMPSWNYRGDELALWHRDQQINDRGIYVDTELAEAALRAIGDERRLLNARTRALTYEQVQAATQRDKLLKYVTAAFGVALPDLTKDTIKRRVEDPELPRALRELLAVRLSSTTTSNAKYRSLLRAVSDDGRLRGCLQFAGASRTARWAGRTFQPQNLPRPSMRASDIERGICALKADCAPLIYDDIMALTSNAIRGCLIAPPGKKLVVADLANIEGRIIAWLAGEHDKLEAFAEYDAGRGPDLYKLAYSRAFAIEADEVNDAQRQIGKAMELMLGFEGGVGAFITGAAAYGIDLDQMAEAALPGVPEATLNAARDFLAWRQRMDKDGATPFDLTERAFVACESLKRLWRAAHPAIESFWPALKSAATMAINRPGEVYEAGRLKLQRTGAWLRIRLPSGRFLCYPGARVHNDTITYMGHSPYARRWTRVKTYGGKLSENATQGLARDVMAANMPRIEAAGYAIVLTVHDEIIAEAPDTAQFNANRLSALLAHPPAWADGLPLAAAGFETYRYRKG